MTTINRQILLASRPVGAPREENFRYAESPLRSIEEGEFLIHNLYISLDAGFRNWMNEDSADNVLPAMALNAPVVGLTVGRVIESRHPDFPEGELLMGRFAWEEYTISDGTAFVKPMPSEITSPLSHYLGILGDTGLSAYFGMMDIGKPQPGETVLVSAAAGAVGSVAGQIAKIFGARTVGITSSEEKCRRLVDDFGYDATIDRNAVDDLGEAIANACPDGVDIYFDSIGGSMLEAALGNLAVKARVVLCGAISTYGNAEPAPGPSNLFELVTKQATMKGFLCHLEADRYDEARRQLSAWIDSGKIKNVEYMFEGIENTPLAFCQMFRGQNVGKTLVRIADE